MDSTAEGQKTLAKFTDALQKVMGPFLALLEAVAVPLFNFLADIILVVADGFAYFAEKVGISTEKIKQAQSGIEDFAAEEKRLAEEKEKRDAEAAEKEKQRLADKKAREAEYRQKKIAADKVLQDATIALMNEQDQKLAQEEIRHQEAMKTLRAAGYKDFTKELARHEQEKEKIREEYREKEFQSEMKVLEGLLKIIDDNYKEKLSIQIRREELLLEQKRVLRNADITDEATSLGIITNLKRRQLENDYQNQIAAYEKSREELKKEAADEKQFDKETKMGLEKIQANHLEVLTNFRIEYYNGIIKLQEDNKQKEKELSEKAIDDQLRILELRSKALQQGTRAYFSLQEEIITKAYEKEKLLAEQAAEDQKLTEKQKAEQLLAIEAKYQKDKKALKDQELQSVGQVASQTINAIAAVTGAIAQGYAAEANNTEKTMQQREAAFEKNKQYQLATAYMSAASGVIQILTQPSTLPSPFDWIVKGINAAALLVATRINTNTIKNTKFQGGASAASAGGTQYADGNFRGYATGGLISGPGSGTSDSIPARLSNGESVINANSTAMFLPLLSAINSMGGGTAFNSNTMVASNDKPMTKEVQEPIIMRAYVVENEMTSIQQRQARLKELSVL